MLTTPRRLRLLPFFALPLLALAEDLLICPACRREAPSGSMFCPKCGTAIAGGTTAPSPVPNPPAAPEPAAVAKLPVVSPAPLPTPAAAVPARSDIGPAAAEGVRICAREGMQQLKDGHPEIAHVLLDNALALASLHPDALTPEQGKTLLEGTRRCDEQLSRILGECPSCQGSGRASMNLTSLGGSAGATQSTMASSIRCRACGGSGRVMRRRTVAERKTAQAAGESAAETVFRTLGFTQEGNAWVPQSLAPLLDIRLRCRLRHAAASPCAQCRGFGGEDCRKCGATGYVPCKAKGCQEGFITEEATNTLDSKAAAIKKRKPCPECGGTAKVPCATCQGRGMQTCTRCNGSGKRAVCATCGGDGYSPCRTCDGSGKAKARGRADASPDTPCAVCDGSGLVFCRSCHGDGHAQR